MKFLEQNSGFVKKKEKVLYPLENFQNNFYKIQYFIDFRRYFNIFSAFNISKVRIHLKLKWHIKVELAVMYFVSFRVEYSIMLHVTNTILIDLR